jgi:hypothetical protein
VETLLVLWIVNSVYDCPCAIRTCSMQHYDSSGIMLWEAKNLDCSYVQEYLKKDVIWGEAQLVLPEDMNGTRGETTDNTE